MRYWKLLLPLLFYVTLAWLAETKLKKQLSIRQRSGLRRQCSAAKERLLNDPNLKSVEITVLGAGSSLIGKSLKTEILREEALELALEGFLPFTERGHVTHGAQRPSDEALDLQRPPGLPAARRFARAPLERRPRQHPVFGRHPSEAGLLQERRDLRLDRGRDQDLRLALRHEAGAFRV